MDEQDLLNDGGYQNEHLRTTIPMSRWKDISSEKYREYRFSCGNLVRIDHPRFLLVSNSGGHRVFDGEYSHYIPAGWIHLHWKAKNDHPHFDF